MPSAERITLDAAGHRATIDRRVPSNTLRAKREALPVALSWLLPIVIIPNYGLPKENVGLLKKVDRIFKLRRQTNSPKAQWPPEPEQVSHWRRVLGENSKAGMAPGEKVSQEAFAGTFVLVGAFQQEVPVNPHDGSAL